MRKEISWPKVDSQMATDMVTGFSRINVLTAYILSTPGGMTNVITYSNY